MAKRRPTRYEIELMEAYRVLAGQLEKSQRDHNEYMTRVNESFARLGGEKGGLEMKLATVERDGNVRLTAERDVYKAMYESLLAKMVTRCDE